MKATVAKSVLVKHQWKNFKKEYTEKGRRMTITAQVRHDDGCGNGHNTFSITGNIFAGGRHKSGGCIHGDIAKHFPELAPLIRFHLFDTEGGPVHYLANTVYLAGERDYNGLLKGEFRQHTSRGKYQADGVEGVPCWELKINGLPEDADVYSKERPKAPSISAEWVPSGTTGEGKPRELDAARSAACWPDATDEDLTAPGLEQRLKKRLPALMKEFRAAVEGLGFTY